MASQSQFNEKKYDLMVYTFYTCLAHMPWFFYPGIPWAQWLQVSCVLALCPASCPPYVLPWWPDISGLAVQLGMGGEAAKRVANVGQTLGFHEKNMWISLISLENAG